MPNFIFTPNYEKALVRIEDYIFSATNSLESVGAFLDGHDKALSFIGENPNTPAIHPVTGDQSWNFGDGRYRLFFRCVERDGQMIIYLTHLIDNKEINLDVYPDNKMPTYDEGWSCLDFLCRACTGPIGTILGYINYRKMFREKYSLKSRVL